MLGRSWLCPCWFWLWLCSGRFVFFCTWAFWIWCGLFAASWAYLFVFSEEPLAFWRMCWWIFCDANCAFYQAYNCNQYMDIFTATQLLPFPCFTSVKLNSVTKSAQLELHDYGFAPRMWICIWDSHLKCICGCIYKNH